MSLCLLSNSVPHLLLSKTATSPTRQTWGIHPMLFQCWSPVFDTGPTLKQHWVNASCLLGIDFIQVHQEKDLQF